MAGEKKVIRKRITKTSTKEQIRLADVGDLVEYGATVHVKHGRKGEFWPRVALTTSVREGETGEDAFSRATRFVHDGLDQQVIEFLGPQ